MVVRGLCHTHPDTSPNHNHKSFRMVLLSAPGQSHPDVKYPPSQVIFAIRGMTAWLVDQAQKDGERFVLWYPVFLGAGVVSYFALPWEPPAHVGLISTLIILSFLIATVIIGRSMTRHFWVPLLLMAIGVEAAQIRTHHVTAPVLQDEQRPRDVTAQVFHVSNLPKGGYKVIVKPSALERTADQNLPERVKITIRSKEPALLPGDWIKVTAVLRGPPGPVSPGAFDFRQMYWFDRIGGVGFSIRKPVHIDPQRRNTVGERLRLSAAKFRAQIVRRVQATLPGQEGAIASALMAGERGAIDKQDTQALRDSGLAHLLAISGLHMGLAGFGIFVAVRRLLALSEPLALSYPIKKWAAGAALFGIAFYLVASGMAVSAQRAFIMTAVIFVAIMLDRSAITLRTVGIAATIMILITPEVVVEAGFQMSFAAVICLVAAYEYFRTQSFWTGSHRKRGVFQTLAVYVAGIVVTSLVASFATSSMAAYHFHRVVHYSVLADLVAMPLMGFVVMPAAIMSFIAMPLGLEAPSLYVMGWGIAQILNVGRFVAGLPGAVHGVAAWTPIAFGLVVLGGLWLCIWREKWRLLGIPMMVLGWGLGYASDQPDVFVSSDGGQVLYRAADGGMVPIERRSNRFETEAWLRLSGDLSPPSAAAQNKHRAHRCDEVGCIVKLPTGQILAYSKDLGAAHEDCLRADILISPRPLRKHCKKPKLVIDKFDLWRNGTYAIWLSRTQIEYKSNRSVEKDRPWIQSVPQ